MPGKVYIGSMNMRGIRAVPPQGAIIVNVTSAQSKQSKNRRDFSPMTFLPTLYKGYGNFEAYWQSGKVFEEIKTSDVKKFWKNVNPETGPKRRYPGSKGKRVLYAKFNGEQMDYIQSRKKVYVPEYYELMKNTEMALYWKNELKKGTDIVVYDFDGPRTVDGEVQCVELTLGLLQEKIHDTSFPFGHGYVVAGFIKDIEPDKYIG
jgi:hypothetical protein